DISEVGHECLWYPRSHGPLGRATWTRCLYARPRGPCYKLGGMFQVGVGDTHNRSPFVTRSTSSTVVVPAITLFQASCRKVRMPSFNAAWRISQELARSWASCRTASVVTHSSNIPCRPAKPNSRQLRQPPG